MLQLSVVSSSTTSLTISWTLAGGMTATGYTISYSNTDTNCFTHADTITDIPGSETIYTLDDLKEGTEYSITVTATLSGGGTGENNITTSTMTAG